MPLTDNAPPIAIGGIGGSGTRIFAAIIREFGYYIGDDLNAANDNLWFTLLFKRRSVLLETDQDFAKLFSVFHARMTGGAQIRSDFATYIPRFFAKDRLQHDKEWLAERAASFLDQESTYVAGQPWGWKEPNTHIIIDRILSLHDTLHYIHVVRNPRYMIASANQNQLQNWGPVFLNREVDNGAGDIIAYWCSAHRRIEAIRDQFPMRVSFMSHDLLCANPNREVRRFADAVALDPPDHVVERAAALVTRRHMVEAKLDLDNIATRSDLAFIERFMDELGR